MRVDLINHTQNPERTVAAAARLCYSDAYAKDLMEGLSEDRVRSLVRKLVGMGHLSPFEHASFTFALEGVSRAMTHQLVRHRIASYSQKSQRYVSEETFDYVIPPNILNDDKASKIYRETVDQIRTAYKELSEIVPREDARYLLPNACESKMVCTFNTRSLMNIFRQRCCNRAQWEIRELADRMLIEVRRAAPLLFENAGPPCEVDGICPEGDFSCGKLEGQGL